MVGNQIENVKGREKGHFQSWFRCCTPYLIKDQKKWNGHLTVKKYIVAKGAIQHG